MFPLVDRFEVEPVFEERMYERHQFKLMIEGKEYIGNFHEGEIQWLNPHPEQDLCETRTEAVETKVFHLLGEHGVIDETDGIEVQSMFADQTHDIHQFKLNIQGEEYKGIFRNGDVQWFHPKPRRKLTDEHVEKVEERVQGKVQEHVDKNNK